MALHIHTQTRTHTHTHRHAHTLTHIALAPLLLFQLLQLHNKAWNSCRDSSEDPRDRSQFLSILQLAVALWAALQPHLSCSSLLRSPNLTIVFIQISSFEYSAWLHCPLFPSSIIHSGLHSQAPNSPTVPKVPLPGHGFGYCNYLRSVWLQFSSQVFHVFSLKFISIILSAAVTTLLCTFNNKVQNYPISQSFI